MIAPEIWIEAWKLAANGRAVIADDVRFPNEAAAVRALGGIVIRIERPGLVAAAAHTSERGVVEADVTILNDGNRAQLGRRIRAALARPIASPPKRGRAKH
ncbi:MAG: hypothetical protein NW216_07655 [Hyphomicrobium sp.]|nr:hypothetical protein [Hyphomicrobium sp.]